MFLSPLSPNTSVIQCGPAPLEKVPWRPDPRRLHGKPAPYVTLQQADSRLHVRVPPCKTPGDTPRIFGRLLCLEPWETHPSDVTAEPSGDQVPVPLALMGPRKRLEGERWDPNHPLLAAYLLLRLESGRRRRVSLDAG